MSAPLPPPTRTLAEETTQVYRRKHDTRHRGLKLWDDDLEDDQAMADEVRNGHIRELAHLCRTAGHHEAARLILGELRYVP